VNCPKCETTFAVEAPEDEGEDEPAAVRSKPARATAADDEDDRPRKKKKKKRCDDEGRSYKNSPLRLVVIGVLLVVLVGLAYLLHKKWQREAQDTHAPPAAPPAAVA
jgi:uncharacterized Zn finger protein (UPF0148 family)